MLRTFFSIIIFLPFIAVQTRTAQAQILNVSAWQNNPPAKVLQKASNYGPADPISATYPSNVKAGNILVLCISASYWGMTVSDSSFHTWTLGAWTDSGGAAGRCFYTISTVNTALTVTVSNTGGFAVMSILEISGVTVLDTIGELGINSGTLAPQSQYATGEPNYFMVNWNWDWNAYVTWTAGPGFAMDLVDGNGSGYIAALQTKWFSNAPGYTSSTISKTSPGNWSGSLFLTFIKKRTPIAAAQVVTASQLSGATLNATFPSPVKAGSTILICANSEGNTFFGDTLNSGYVGITGIGGILCYRYTGSLAGTLTVSVTGTKTTGLYAVELRGYVAFCGNAVDQNGGGGATVTMTSNPITSPNSYVFAFGGNYWPPTTYTTYSLDPSSAAEWTQKAQVGSDGSGQYTAAFYELNQKQGLSGTKTMTFNAAVNMDKLEGVLAFCNQ